MKATSRKSYLKKTLIFGTMTAGLFAAVFSNSDFVMHYCTKGGVYASAAGSDSFCLSPMFMVLSQVIFGQLSVLRGLKAAVLKQTKIAEKRPDTRPRVHASA